jgi:hypothetical protein
MISAQRKRRLVSLVRNGKSATEARAQVGVSRTTAWRWLKEAKAEDPEPVSSEPGQPRESDAEPDQGYGDTVGAFHDPDVRHELEAVLPPAVLAALEAPDDPDPAADAAKTTPDSGLPHVVIDAGDPEQPSTGFGQREMPQGHPALNPPGPPGTSSYVPGRFRSFAYGLNPSEADLGPDRDLMRSTMRPAAPGVGLVKVFDTRESQQRLARRRPERRRGSQASWQGFTPPMVIGGR